MSPGKLASTASPSSVKILAPSPPLLLLLLPPPAATTLSMNSSLMLTMWKILQTEAATILSTGVKNCSVATSSFTLKPAQPAW